MVLRHNLSKLLSQEESEDDDDGKIFDLVYRGLSEVDRHYTKPMLPWLISEIKNQHRMQQVSITIKNGRFIVKDKKTGDFIMKHDISQIHKCVMEQADHRCFLYTLRPHILETPETCVESPPTEKETLQPCNITANQNYECHLYQALTEEEVRSFFACLRQQPKNNKMKEADKISQMNSLPELSVSIESQFFEVLFVGRVKVSHCKVPATFIDEALQAFRSREKKRQSEASREVNTSPSRVMAFQQEGSGYSVPNIVLHNPGDTLSSKSRQKSPSTGESVKESKSMVRFHLGSVDDPSQDVRPNISPQSSISGHTAKSLAVDIKEASVLHEPSSPEMKTFNPLSSEPRDMLRARHLSGDCVSSSVPKPSLPEPMQRARAGSFGSILARQHSLRPVESDSKMLSGSDFNRTMLLHIGHREIQLVNPELKSVQLNKQFKDISGCCLGVQASDHFGFICKELSGESIVYVSYIFRCEKKSVAEEIMQALNRSFSAMHEAHEKDRQEHLMCDFCPLKWLSHVCSEVEGCPAPKAHTIIMKRVSLLPEDERESIIAKYEGVETHDIAQKNNVLMMLLRTHFEYKQMNHRHPTDTCAKGDFSLSTNIESSLKRAKKSLTSSFSQLLKREEGPERESSPVVENRSGILRRSRSPDVQALPPSPGQEKSYILQGISDSPLKPHRARSSTLTAAGGEAIRKEILSKKAQTTKEDSRTFDNDLQKERTPPTTLAPPKIEKPEEDVASSTSFRHAILQRVASPRVARDSPNRKVSTCVGYEKDSHDVKRDIKSLITIWKKVTFQIIMLNKIEMETKRIKFLQKEAALLKVRLNYDEEELPGEALRAWEMMLSRADMEVNLEFLHLGVQQGIPKLLRGEVWNLLTSLEKKGVGVSMSRKLAAENRERSPLYFAPYEKVLKELTSQQHAILIDLGRTFPSHPYFTKTLGPGQLSLFNILKAYSIVDKEVGYCQGLCFVGGVLLLHAEEEDAYELLKYVMFEKGCRMQYRHDLDGLQIQMYQLSRLLRDNFIELHNHLEAYEVTPQLYAAPWFLTLFSSQFPMSFVVRVFDFLFLNGMEAVFAVCVVLLRIHEQELLALTSFEQIMYYFKNNVAVIHTEQLSQFFAEVSQCNFSRNLTEYEVEYRVLQEEQIVSPQQLTDMKRLTEANHSLKRTNLELLEQLHAATRKQNKLESINQGLQQSQHHLEVRVRWLELEKNNMRHLINILCKSAPKEALENVTPNLERYLPDKASTPAPTERRHVTFSNTIEVSDPTSTSSSRQPNKSPVMSREPSPALRLTEPSRIRSTTLDTDSLRNYFSHTLR